MLNPEVLAARHYEVFELHKQSISNEPLVFDRTSWNRNYFNKAADHMLDFLDEASSGQFTAEQLLMNHGVEAIELAFLEDAIGERYSTTSGKVVIEVDISLKDSVEIADTIAHEFAHVLINEAQRTKNCSPISNQSSIHSFVRCGWPQAEPFMQLEEAWCEDFVVTWLDQYGYRAAVTNLAFLTEISDSLGLKLC